MIYIDNLSELMQEVVNLLDDSVTKVQSVIDECDKSIRDEYKESILIETKEKLQKAIKLLS